MFAELRGDVQHLERLTPPLPRVVRPVEAFGVGAAMCDEGAGEGVGEAADGDGTFGEEESKEPDGSELEQIKTQTQLVGDQDCATTSSGDCKLMATAGKTNNRRQPAPKGENGWVGADGVARSASTATRAGQRRQHEPQKLRGGGGEVAP